MIAYGDNIKIFCGNSNPEFAKTICKELGLDLGKSEVKTFADGEVSVTLDETVRGADVFLIQSTCKPVNNNLMELLIMIDACRRAYEAMLCSLKGLQLGLTPDAVLTDVEEAMEAMGEVTGATVREDITARIFERFCVGK